MLLLLQLMLQLLLLQDYQDNEPECPRERGPQEESMLPLP